MNIKKYVKKPVIKEAYKFNEIKYDEYELFKLEEGELFHTTIETLEGKVKVNMEDYIIIGVNGEKYPCSKETFESTYKQCQIKPYHYETLPIVVEAYQTDYEATLYIGPNRGYVKANVGDWIIKGVHFFPYVCSNDVFVKSYQELEERK